MRRAIPFHILWALTAYIASACCLSAQSDVASLTALAANKLTDAAGTRIAERRDALLDETQALCRRALAIEPQNVNAVFALGVLGWMRAFPATEEARGRPNARARIDLTARFWQTIEDAASRFRTVVQLDPLDDHAMTYLSLLYREKAELEPDPEGWRRDTAEADEWLSKALETALANGATGKEVHTRPTPPVISEAYLHYPVYRRDDLTLVYSVKPEYPEAAKQARIEGVVTVGAIVGKDGKVTRVQAVNGHPLLVPAAITAVKQWLYRPVMVNGEPVEVRTTIQVTFSLRTG